MTPEWEKTLRQLSNNLQMLAQKIQAPSDENPLHGIQFMLALGKTYLPLLKKAAKAIIQKPGLIEKALEGAHQDLLTLTHTLRKRWDNLPSSPLEDKRFRHAEWNENPYFYTLKELYLVTCRHSKELIASVELPEKESQQLQFCLRFLLECLSPNNHWFGNPEAWILSRKTQGLNWLKGVSHFVEDVIRWQGHLNLTKTRPNAFRLGIDLAATPGRIIYTNELMDLIQYDPLVPVTEKTPLLFVISWINKYYIVDLREKNSVVRALLSKGWPVFVIAWKNPEPQQAHLGFEEYLIQGVIEACEQIQATTGASQVHGVGYCLGGTLLACANAYLSAIERPLLATITTIASLTDFSMPGTIGDLMGAAQVALFEERMETAPLWSGQKMHLAFNLTASNEFIWPFAIRRYLHGKEPIDLDTLYWGLDLADTTKALYRFYIEDLHLHNRLKTPGSMKVNGIPLDLSHSHTPWACISFLEDTVSPWQACLQATEGYQGEVFSLISEGEHITGLLHPEQFLCRQPQEAEAREKDWRMAWQDWLKGKRIAT